MGTLPSLSNLVSNLAGWQAQEAARAALAPERSHREPAARYGVARLST